MMAIKSFGPLVLGVYDQSEDRHFRARGSRDRIPQQGAAKPLTLVSLIDGETPEPRHGDGRIAWQAFDDILRHVAQGNGGGGERIKPGDAGCGRFDGDVAGGYPPADILCNARGEVVIKGLDAAAEARPVVVRSQDLKPKRPRHGVPNRRA
jgi:hypothetical protein